MCVSLLLSGCGSANNDVPPPVPVADDVQVPVSHEYAPGIVHSGLIITGTEERYALYIPTRGIEDGSLIKTVYFLDPQGEGSVPLEKYKAYADSLGYLLIGSETSRNGMSMQAIGQHFAQLKKEAETRFKAHQTAYGIAGFSGGSRAALQIGQSDVPPAGIIACSGMSPPANQFQSSKAPVFGLVGKGDFNFYEYEDASHLSWWDDEGLFFTFDGKHEWPPAEWMGVAFAWLELTISGATSNRHPAIQSLRKPAVDAFDDAKARKDYVTIYRLVHSKPFQALMKKDVARLIDGFDVSPWPEHNTTWQNQLVEEKVAMRNVSLLLMKNDPASWKTEATNLIADCEKSDWPECRKLALMSMQLYSLTGRSVAAKNMVLAEPYIEVYKMVEPDRHEPYYFSAMAAMIKEDHETATAELKVAIENGFHDADKLQSDPAFASLPGKEELIQLINGR